MRDKFKERADLLEPERGNGKVKYEAILNQEIERMDQL
jgi:hypothetical protein